MCHVFITEFGILFKMYYDFFPDPQTFISILKTTVGLFYLYIINFINFEKIYSELFQSFEILITGTTTLSNSMKLSHALGATQDRRVIVERFDRMRSTGEGNGKPIQYSCLEKPMNSMKRQNYRILKEELPRSLGAHYATGNQWRNNSRKNEGMEPKQKQYPVLDVTGYRRKVQWCKEKYCIGT